MPRLSLDAELDRLLAESVDATRFVDVAMVLRRLTLTHHVPEKAKLTDDDGRVWIAGEVADDGKQPVATEIVGASRTFPAGLALRTADGVETELEVEIVCSAGGVWDRQRKNWRLDAAGQRMAAQHPVVVDLMESQVDVGRWAKERLKAFRERRPHPHSVAELYSDRRAGKTFVGVLLVLLMAIDCPATDGKPQLVAWLVSQSHPARDEIDREIKAILPPHLYSFRELPKRQFILVNGSTLQHKTVDDVQSLRSGYVDVALLNEAMLMSFEAYRVCLRATQDHNGFLVLATNDPPKGRTKGNWVARIAQGSADDFAAGREPAVKVFRPDPRKNAAVSSAAKQTIDRALMYGLDSDETLDEGQLREADERCYAPPFAAESHVKQLPLFGLVDVTADVLYRLRGRRYDVLVGHDYQRQCAGVAMKIMAKDSRPESWAQFTLVAVSAWFFEGGGDEDDLLDAMELEGFTAERCFVVGDTSGQWQKGDHGFGPVSFATVRRRGFDIDGPTKPRTAKAKFGKNPDIPKSVGQLRLLIQAGRFVVAAGEQTKQLQKAFQRCDARVNTRTGAMGPSGIWSHSTDAVKYAHHWLASNVNGVAAQLPNYVLAASGRR